jgi:hypothetical protein
MSLRVAFSQTTGYDKQEVIDNVVLLGCDKM